MKKIIWIGSSLSDLKDFPDEVQDEMGYELYLVQEGFVPTSAKPLKGFDIKVFEIISDFKTDTFRVVYTVKLGDFVYVLHAFQKKSKQGIKTPKYEIDLIHQRLLTAKKHARGHNEKQKN